MPSLKYFDDKVVSTDAETDHDIIVDYDVVMLQTCKVADMNVFLRITRGSCQGEMYSSRRQLWGLWTGNGAS